MSFNCRACLNHCVMSVAFFSLRIVLNFSAFLVNSSDRIIRVFDGQIILACKGQNAEPEPIQKLQDLVNR